MGGGAATRSTSLPKEDSDPEPLSLEGGWGGGESSGSPGDWICRSRLTSDVRTEKLEVTVSSSGSS